MKTILMLFLALPLLHAQQSVTPEDRFLACTKDSQCKHSPNDCAQCCGPGTAVNQKYFSEFQQLVRKNCEQYQGAKCNCVASTENWIPSCVTGKCVMLSEKAGDQHRACLKRGGFWQGTTPGRGRLTGCNMPTKDGGKPCTNGEDCESVCVDGKCHGSMMYKGCARFKGHAGETCVD